MVLPGSKWAAHVWVETMMLRKSFCNLLDSLPARNVKYARCVIWVICPSNMTVIKAIGNAVNTEIIL
jgi:hypothetical protein